MSRRGSLLRKLALATGSALATLFLGELAARVWLGERFRVDVLTDLPMNACVTHDPELGWRNRPGLRAEATGPTLQFPVFRYRVTINSRGLRDRETTPEPAPGVTRIVLLGDSFAWGWGVDDGECFADRLEQRLAPAVEVVNAGVPGYSTDQELLWLEREGLGYRPTLVFLCLLLNDVEGNHDLVRDELGKPRLAPRAPPAAPAEPGSGGFEWENLPVATGPGAERFPADGPLQRLRRSSALFSLRGAREVVRPAIESEWSKLSPDELRALLQQQEWPFFDEAKIERFTAELVDATSPTHELLRRMQASVTAAGATLVVFSVAHYHDYYLTVPGKPQPPAVAEAEAAGLPFRTRLATRLSEAGEQLGFETLSVDQAMLDATRAGRMLNVGDGHLNEAGNELVAAELERWVRAWLERRPAGNPEGGTGG